MLAFEHVEEVETEPFSCALEEYSAIHFRMDEKIPGSFTTCQLCNGRKSDTAFEVYGSRCSYAWNHKDATRLWIGNRFKPNEELIENAQIMHPEAGRFASLPGGHPLGYNDAVLHLFQEYYAAIEAGEGASDDTLRPTFHTGFEEMKILDAIVASHKNRRWEKVG